MVEVADGYRMVDGSPSVEEYLALRERSGLSPKSYAQARAGVGREWTACHVVQTPASLPGSRQAGPGGRGGGAVAMGRVIGDGGWYFHIIDMAVLPEHQRRGLGDAVLTELVDRIRADAPPGAWVTLLADPPGRRLYARHGFTETAPGSIGMALTLR